MVTNIEFLNYQDHISDLMSEGYLSRQQGYKLIDKKYEEFNTMSSTTNKIATMQAYDRGESIKCTNRTDESNFIFHYKDNRERAPVWDWLRCYYEVMSPPVKFTGFVNVGRKELYSGSTVFRTQELAEDNSCASDTRVAVSVLVTEIVSDECCQ